MAAKEAGLSKQYKPALVLNLAKYYGGAEVRTLQMARMLQKAHYPFCVVALHGSPLHHRLVTAGLPVQTINLNRADFRIAFRLKKMISDGGYRVIDTHNPQSHLWGLLAAKMSKDCHVVTTVHGCYGEAETGWTAKLYDAVLRWNDEPEAQFIAVSDSVQSYLRRIGIKLATITYSANAVLAEETNEQAATIRDIAGWNKDTLVITIAARLEPVKGIEYLLQAFAKACQSCPQMRLCIIGEGRSKVELEQLSVTLGVTELVCFTGFRDDVTGLLNSADIFCLSSLSEGLPFALLEAAMAKLPLVLSSVGGMAEFFTHQQTALMFPMKDVKQLAEHFVTLADNAELRKKLGAQACQWVATKFLAQQMYEQTIDLYQGRKQ